MIGSAKLSRPLGLQTQVPSYFIMISIFWQQMVGEQRSLTWFMRQSRMLQREETTTLDKITVVLGPHAPWREQVTKQAADMPVPTQVLSGVDNMAELMTSCDLAIGAGGSTTRERCALGVPTVTIVLAENQQEVALRMESLRASLVVKSTQGFENKLSELSVTLDEVQIKDLSERCRNICDGSGVHLVTQKMEN